MSIASKIFAEGSGWSVRRVVCDAGPEDRPFEERHETFCIAAVTGGTFQYRTGQGRALMAPGSLLLGEAGACFECGHEHARGDRCISFTYGPELMEEIASAIPGRRSLGFGRPHLPAQPASERLLAAAEAAAPDHSPARWEEIAVDLAGTALSRLSDAPAHVPSRSSDERRVTAVLRLIESEPDAELSLATLAGAAAMSRFHFLRVFRALVGVTPYQHLLRMRLHRAALAIGHSAMPISTIAFACGFGDLSTFNRRFRRIYGMPPGAFRRSVGASGRPSGLLAGFP